MIIKKYEGCAVDGHHGIYTAQVFAERYPDFVIPELLPELLSGPDNEEYFDAKCEEYILSKDNRLFEYSESGDILEYSLIDTDLITIDQLSELAQPIPGGKMSVYENQFGYADIAMLGENCLCRIHQTNTGIISADCFFEMDDCYSLDKNLQQFIEFELRPKLREEFEEDHIIVTLPSHYASYLINGDASGLNDAEQVEIDSFILKADVGLCIGCSDDSWFAASNDLDNLGAAVMEFYFEKIKGE